MSKTLCEKMIELMSKDINLYMKEKKQLKDVKKFFGPTRVTDKSNQKKKKKSSVAKIINSDLKESKVQVFIHPVFSKDSKEIVDIVSPSNKLFFEDVGSTVVLEHKIQNLDKYGGFTPLIEIVQYCTVEASFKAIINII